MIHSNDIDDTILVEGARVHNLKNIDVEIPHNKLTVITGLSGSGKSSLAFDTIYAEGQRRYIDTFSAYARRMLGGLERPDVDKIEGLTPVISIEQKTINKNPRSTIGTITEVYDFLRLLYARIGEAVSYLSGEKMVKYSEQQIVDLILQKYAGKKTMILAPLVNNRKGHYKDLFEQYRRKGYLNVRVDGEIYELVAGMKVDRYRNHNIELVVDKLKVVDTDRHRLSDTVALAMKQAGGLVMIYDVDADEVGYYSKTLMDPATGLSYREPAPHNFSFNSPLGACPHCKGLGYVNVVDKDKIIPDKSKSIHSGGILPLGSYKNTLIFNQIAALCENYGFTLKTPIEQLPDDLLNDILNGTGERLALSSEVSTFDSYATFDGVLKFVESQQDDDDSAFEQKRTNRFFSSIVCPECHGARLNKEAMHFFVAGKSIYDLSAMQISDLKVWFDSVADRLSDTQNIISREIIKEIKSRLSFMCQVGLGYLSLIRGSSTLSGGESQRIRLATQLGSQLVNVTYILDEPSIGLHQRDNERLIESLKQLRDSDNTIIVVEHDKDIMLQADYVIDIGPGAGRAGGNVVFAGTPDEMLRADTMTSRYLNGKDCIPVPDRRRAGNGKTLTLRGCTGNNLKSVDFTLPLGMFVCVTGVSGSGKSSLVNGTLQPILSQIFHKSLADALPYKSVEGVENLNKIITIDQSPIGRLPRSNPATYTKLWDDIRDVFVRLPESRIRGYRPGRFSFNATGGGKCPECKGNGYKTIEMNFLPNVFVTCPACGGKRFDRETLEVRYKGKSIADVLDMTINQAAEFFENIPSIARKLRVLQSVGLGYVKLGQPSSTLSGGECQRIKLALHLSRPDTGKTLFILDEPTTGLHFHDISLLLDVLNALVDKGNTVLVIEHNMDVIKCADYVVDMGPDGGTEGGRIVAEGTPEQIAKSKNSITGRFLRKEI